jgi:hypothetical protein
MEGSQPLENSMPLFQKTLVRASEKRFFQIKHTESSGWDTCEMADDRVARRQHRTEWHRVERDLARFEREIDALQQQGWSETG